MADEIRRAFAQFEIKEIHDPKNGKRTFRGIATTPTVDREGDIVEPEGAEFKLPIPFLWQHNSYDPIGWITAAKVTKKGIEVEGEIATVDEPPSLKERLDLAYGYIKSKLVRGLSIGFKPLESSRINDTYSYRFIKWLWLELSAVTIPANGDASIMGIKSAFEAQNRSAFGTATKGSKPSLPGVAGVKSPSTSAKKGHNQMAKSIAEQLAAFDNRRKQAKTRMEELMNLASEEERVLSPEEQEEYDTLKGEVEEISKHMGRLKDHEKIQLENSTPVTPKSGAGEGAVEVPGQHRYISVHRNLPKGTAFTRYTMAVAASKGNLMQAERLSQQWKDTPEVNLVLRAAVDAGTTSDTTWAGPLVQYQDMVTEFIDLLRNATILGRMNALRRVPFNIRVPRKTSGSTGSFVGEGSPTPVREMAFDNITLPWAKASAIIVITAELARMSSPSAEALVRQDLIDGISEYLDKRLIDPAYPGVTNVSPASLTHGVTPRNASGTTLGAIDDDVAYCFQQFANANIPLTSGIWVLSPALAITLSMLRTNQDTPAFPGMTVNGGTFYGLPAVTSNSVAPSGSPGDQHLILVCQNEVMLADEGQMMIDASMEASVQMNDAPSAGAQSLVSLWQNGLMGVKVDRWIYWTKRRSQAVQFIDMAQRYGS